MLKKIAIALLLMIGTATLASGAEIVKFPSTGSEGLALEGKLRMPEGDGPFPAVIMLHGCGGPNRNLDPWDDKFISWGYVTLRVNSFGPRGVSNVCAYPGEVDFPARACDAHDAKSYLSGFPFVDSKRIAVIGWSHGGGAAICALDQNSGGKGRDPFRAGIAIHPSCRYLLDMNAPLLILIGEKDDWTSAEICMAQMPEKEKPGHEIILKVYPGVYHGFTYEGMDRTIAGHRLLYDPAASADAAIQIKAFLAKHVK